MVYDTAFRGKHLRELLQLVVSIAPMAARTPSPSTPSSFGAAGRAHSYRWRRQFLDLVGFALLINAGAAASFERRVAARRPPDAATP